MTERKNLIIGSIIVVIIVGASLGFLLLTSPEEKTTIIVGTTFEIGRVLHPLTVNGGDDPIVFNVFEGLMGPRPDIMATEPVLATDYPIISADGLEYTFTLREGVKFHDGTPFNASCVKYHFDIMFEHGAGMTYFFTENVLNYTEVIDLYTVKLVLTKPNTNFLYDLGNIAGWIGSPTAIEKYGVENVNDHPVGTGPLKFVSRIPDTEVVLAANDDWWQLDNGKEITVDEVIFVQVADPATLAIAIQNGEVDLTDGRMNLGDYATLLANPNLKTYDTSASSSRRWLTFTMNSTLWEVFPNKTMRQAFSYAIPYEEIISVPLQGYGQMQYSLLTPEHPDYNPVAKYHYNTTKALELIEEAGFTPPVAVTLHITPTHYGNDPDVAALIKERALPAGFDVSIVQEEYAAYKTRYQTTGEQEMCLWSWKMYPQFNWFDTFLSSNKWGVGYSQGVAGDMAILYPYIDNLIAEMGGSTNATRVTEIAIELQDLWAEWLPQIWVWREVRYQFSRLNIDGLIYGLEPWSFHLHNLIKT